MAVSEHMYDKYVGKTFRNIENCSKAVFYNHTLTSSMKADYSNRRLVNDSFELEPNARDTSVLPRKQHRKY